MELPFRHTLLAPWITDGRAHLVIGPDVVPVRGDARWSVRSATLRGGMRDGVDVVEVDNGLLSFSVVPTRGMGIWKGRCGRLRLGWDSPVAEPVHPSLVNSGERGGLGWLRGFNEWIVRCGLGSMGAPGPDTMTDNNGNTADRADGYVTGLEPATGFPNPRRFEREKGRVPVLGPGESRTTSLVAAAHTDAESVAAVAKAVAKLAPPDGPRVDTVPQPDWSPV